MTRLPARCAAAACCAVVASCAPPAPPQGDYPAIALDGGDAEPEAAADVSASGSLSADGTWIFWYETSTCVNVLGIAINSLTQTLTRVELHSEPGGIVRHTLLNCQVEQTPIVGVATTIPDAVVQSIPTREFIALLDGDGVGASYQSQIGVELWGVKLDDPYNDPLPTDKSDPRVYDQDGDGKPGVTLDLGHGQCTMAVIQRAISRWTGTVQSPTRIEGTGSNDTVQVVMEASSGFCSSQYETWNPPNTARFALQRVDGEHGAIDLDTDADGQVSCEEIRAYGSAPFAPREVDNAACRD